MGRKEDQIKHAAKVALVTFAQKVKQRSRYGTHLTKLV